MHRPSRLHNIRHWILQLITCNPWRHNIGSRLLNQSFILVAGFWQSFVQQMQFWGQFYRLQEALLVELGNLVWVEGEST